MAVTAAAVTSRVADAGAVYSWPRVDANRAGQQDKAVRVLCPAGNGQGRQTEVVRTRRRGNTRLVTPAGSPLTAPLAELLLRSFGGLGTRFGNGTASRLSAGLTGREKCARGHIPNKLNIAVGQAYKKFIKTQRLLNDNKFWLEVADR